MNIETYYKILKALELKSKLLNSDILLGKQEILVGSSEFSAATIKRYFKIFSTEGLIDMNGKCNYKINPELFKKIKLLEEAYNFE